MSTFSYLSHHGPKRPGQQGQIQQLLDMSPAAVHNVERRLRGPAKQALDGSVTSLLLVADVSVRACRAFHTRKLNDLASSLGSP